jgi:PAS domain S-box-containing protein
MFKHAFPGESNQLSFSFSDIIIPADQHRVQWALDNCITKQVSSTVQASLKIDSQEKTFISVKWEFSPVIDDNGKLIEIAGIGYPVEASEDLTNTIINCLPGIFYMQDENRKFLMWNDNFEKVVGYSAEEISKLNSAVFYKQEDVPKMAKAIEKAHIEGSGEIEIDIVNSKGNVTPYYFNGRSIEYNGKRCLIGIGMDISKQVQAQNKISESEKRYHSLFEQASDPILITDFEGNFVDVNSTMCNSFGYTRDELLQMNIRQLIHAENLKESPMRFDLLAKGQHVFNQRTMIHKNGSLVYVEANVKKFTDNLVMAIARDVTELRNAQNQISVSEARFRGAFQYSGIGMALVSLDGKWLKTNTQLSKIVGYSEQELLSNDFADITHPDEIENSQLLLNHLVSGQMETCQMEKRYIHKDGSVIWANLHISIVRNQDNKPIYLVTQIEDITMKKAVESQLVEAEMKFRNLVEQSLAGVYIMQNGKFTYVNPRFAEIFGYEQEELIESYSVDVIVEKDFRKLVEEKIRARMDGDIDSMHYELVGQKKDGQQLWAEVFGSRTLYKGMPAVIGTLIDITERKLAVEAIKESEERYRTLVDNAPEALVVLDVEKQAFVSVSESAVKLFGMSREHLLKVGLRGINPEFQPDGQPSAEKAMDKLNQAIQGGKPFFEWTHCNADGQLIPCEVWLVRLPSENKILIRGSIIDISERKRIEAERERISYQLNERVKELTTLYRFGQVLQVEHESIEEVMQELVTVIPHGWQFSDITAARIRLGDMEFTTENYNDGHDRQTASFRMADGTTAVLEVVYLEERPLEDEGPFASEERFLINMLAEMFRVYLLRKQEAEVLKNSEANLHTILDTTDTIYILLDKEFKILSYNKPAVRFAEKELNHFMKTSDFLVDYFPGEKAIGLLSQMRKASEGKTVRYEVSYLQEDGNFNWYEVRIFPIYSEGELLGIMVAATDFTEKRFLEKAILDQKIQEQKKISRAIIQAQEKERNYIGQELHDNVNQILAGTKLYLSMAGTENARTLELIKYPMELVDSCIKEIRILSSKQVTPLKNIRLKELIQSLLDNLHANANIQTEFNYNLLNQSIPDDIRLNIYRIIQEQINNIIKHAKAENVSIRVNGDNKIISIDITDDGIGFNVGKKRKGIGISNMINRVESFNGQLNIKSSPGNGCKIEIRIPF